MKAVLALDLATKTGWALQYTDGSIVSGVQRFALKHGDSPGMRFVRFRDWLETLVSTGCVNIVIYEQPHLRGGPATTVLVGLETHLQSVCAEEFQHGTVEHTRIQSRQLKLFATGKGNASKDSMLAAARKKWPDQDIIDDNQADALWALEWARSEGLCK